jgi:hypothetical protein
MQLKAALELPDGSLPGFTRTCDCTVMIGDGKRATAHFQGMVMEQINGARGRAARGREGRAPAAARPTHRAPPPAGWDVGRRVADPAFHNIHYVREMLFQVLSALDRAQRAVG